MDFNPITLMSSLLSAILSVFKKTQFKTLAHKQEREKQNKLAKHPWLQTESRSILFKIHVKTNCVLQLYFPFPSDLNIFLFLTLFLDFSDVKKNKIWQYELFQNPFLHSHFSLYFRALTHAKTLSWCQIRVLDELNTESNFEHFEEQNLVDLGMRLSRFFVFKGCIAV